jgi:hypothetical protein
MLRDGRIWPLQVRFVVHPFFFIKQKWMFAGQFREFALQKCAFQLGEFDEAAVIADVP